MRISFAVLLLILPISLLAQKKTATISGTVVDENENPLENVSVSILGKQSGTLSNQIGNFIIQIPSEKALALTFSYAGYQPIQRNFYLSSGEVEKITVRLTASNNTLETVVISDQRERKENSLVKINPKNALILPGPAGGVEGLIKSLVGSNNELTSQYSVRGGNFDENLVYINDIEVFRPYLVSNAQQEGLSIINPELAKSVNFQSGGFQAKYGDKISSVLDIQYKKPSAFGGSAYLGLTEQGVHLEGTAAKGNITYLIGARNKSNRNILSNQPTVGSYIPSSSDIQGYVTGKISNKLQLELLGIFSSSRFSFYPESVKKTAAVFSPLFSQSLGLDIYFEGQEKDNYNTNLYALTLVHTVSKKLKIKWILSSFKDLEKENYDIAGSYVFGERDFDNNSGSFGNIVNPLGMGYYQQYGRNNLNIHIWNLAHRGSFDQGNHNFQWGFNAERTLISDKLNQWEYRDSAGYSIPYASNQLTLFQSIHSSTELSIQKYSGFIQDNIRLIRNNNEVNIQGGLRIHYNTLNKEWLLSPRINMSWIPAGKQDLILRAAAGIYDQPPFYRELRDYDGNLNTDILAQRSIQFVAGADYKFINTERPFRITSEIYYKSLSKVIPYDIDNVKIRYLGNNEAKAYAMGAEVRIFGQLLRDAESWLSLGWMKTYENLGEDYYYQYLNAVGEVIGSQTNDKIVADSNRVDVGWLRRPSDRRFTVGLFLQDYLATNKNFKVHLNMLYGSNMSYNIPNSVRYRNALTINPYIRVDIGFSVLLLDEKSMRRSHSPFGNFENIWLSLEVFNLINRANTISYQLIKDYSGNTYAIPNRLTPRLLNLKLVARF